MANNITSLTFNEEGHSKLKTTVANRTTLPLYQSEEEGVVCEGRDGGLGGGHWREINKKH